MGGNGARSAFMARTLDSYTGVRFNEVGCIGDVKVVAVNNRRRTTTPMESFSSRMYYVVNPQTGFIDHIAFYDNNGNIKHSIDLEFDANGSPLAYREYIRKGKLHSEGCHFHRDWKVSENGDKGRIRHLPSNTEAINRYYMRFVNRAAIYNKTLKNNE